MQVCIYFLLLEGLGRYITNFYQLENIYRIVNTKYPNMIRGVKKSGLSYVQMENISKFLAALERFGVPKSELFTTVDLFEEKDMQSVVLSLERLAHRWPTLDPPE